MGGEVCAPALYLAVPLCKRFGGPKNRFQHSRVKTKIHQEYSPSSSRSQTLLAEFPRLKKLILGLFTSVKDKEEGTVRKHSRRVDERESHGICKA
jgi:hypothetical protein